MPKPSYDCNDKCIAKTDECGVCGGKGAGTDKSKCGHPAWGGDTFCDMDNNNCRCGWDKGDCCGMANTYTYCKPNCKCNDPTFIAPAPKACQGKCSNKQWQGDGNCDDNNNVCGCDWDGGDCCGAKPAGLQYCNKDIKNKHGVVIGCKCLNPDYVPDKGDGCGQIGCKGKCNSAKYVGDGNCDDNNNNCGCDWDGGDCCGPKGYKFCVKCKCLDCHYIRISDKCTDDIRGMCGKPDLKGDVFCDDENNNAGCAWDGGDCCGQKNNYDYCKKPCKCKDCTFTFKSDKCTDQIKGSCGAKDFVGDGFCDDGNNNAGCSWDQGDCCGSSGKGGQFQYCAKPCKCKDCTYQPKGDTCVSSIKGGCGHAAWKGDKVCDDDNNNAGCNWDGGDCCGAGNKYKPYCKKCECRDCTFAAQKDDCTKNIMGACGAPKYKGDDICDDNNNNAGCAWDGGDCCGSSGHADQKKYCKACKCLDCTYKEVIDKCSGKQVKGACGAPLYKGDGFCDDENNNGFCGWDKGDCCGPTMKYNLCTKCKCLDCDFKGLKCPKVGKCGTPDWKGDKNCDDENNNCACSWDGGDCCGKKNVYTFCKKCECLDPLLAYCNTKCGSPTWTGDGVCDDNNNNCGCGWDKGDCCGDTKNPNQLKYCDKKEGCKCLDPEDPDYVPNKIPCLGECSHPNWRGDGVCDDGNNNCACDYDNGDCCGDSKNKNQFVYCAKKPLCKCVDPTYTTIKS